MTKHTPGVVDGHEDETQGIAKAYKAYDEANARLIAAAPELLEACKLGEELLRLFIEQTKFGDNSGVAKLLSEFQKAIAKAEGV